MSKNGELDELRDMLCMVHRAYIRQVAENSQEAGKTLETHWLIRRLIEEQAVEATMDFHAVFEAANIAHELDPNFSFDERGSCVSLLRKIVDAVDKAHSHQNDLVSSLLSKLTDH